MNAHAAPLTAVPSPSVARIPPDLSLPPDQRNWHERFPYRDYVELAADPAAVPSARHRLRLDLREWGLHQLLDDAELVTAEIVSNAVNATCAAAWPASRPPVRLWVRADIGLLFVLAWDAIPQLPQPVSPSILDEAGRGLLLIDAFSRWGYYHPPGDDAGKVIWTQLPKPGIQ
jgi:anti-sigma regulatory factor (Ser/Thr protein kinase)